jgi:hypothetical protein
MSAIAALPLAFSGMALIGLSIDRHARQAAFAIKARGTRAAGWLLLILSLAAELVAPNWRFAIIEWIGLAGAAAGIVVLILYHRPRILVALAAGGAALGVIGWVLSVVRL